MKTWRSRFAWAALTVLIGVNAWMYWPSAWRFTPTAAIERAGGKVEYLTVAGHEGEPCVRLPPTVTDEDLERMTALDQLQPTVVFLQGGPVGNRGAASLKRLRRLRFLSLWGTKVDDEGLRILKEFPDLEMLNLEGCPITDRGLEHLQGLPQLLDVSLYGTKVTAAGARQLQAARPNMMVRSRFTLTFD